MEQNSKLDEIGIGTKEKPKLQPASVTIQGNKITPFEKQGKVVGRRVSFMCKHPEKQEQIEISSVEYVKDAGGKKTIRNSALWLNQDEEGNIQMGSPLALLLAFAGSKTIKGMDSKVLPTVLDASGYLCLKAY